MMNKDSITQECRSLIRHCDEAFKDAEQVRKKERYKKKKKEKKKKKKKKKKKERKKERREGKLEIVEVGTCQQGSQLTISTGIRR